MVKYHNAKTTANYLIESQVIILYVLSRLLKLPGSFEYHWLGNLGSLCRNKEIQPQ